MENLFIPSRSNTPLIDFRSDSGILRINGISTPEDPFVFYLPVINWLERFAQEPTEQIILEIELEYFNTSTSRVILHLLKMFKSEFPAGSVRIHWMIEDEDDDLFEVGKDFGRILKEMNFLILQRRSDLA